MVKKMEIPRDLKLQAMRELPDGCKGHLKCIKQPFFQMECECECYKENVARLFAEKRSQKNV